MNRATTIHGAGSDLGGSSFSSVLAESSFFWSPMTVVSGQNLNIGHFSQPTARAMGHKVITLTSFERDIIRISVILNPAGAGVKSLIACQRDAGAKIQKKRGVCFSDKCESSLYSKII